MDFQSVSHIDGIFKLNGSVDLPDSFTVHELKYNFLSEHTIPIRKMFNSNEKSFVVYCIDKENKESDKWKSLLNDGIINEWIVFVWDKTKNLSMIPAGAISVPSTSIVGLEEKSANVIPDEVNIKFDRFGKSIKGKVDTGANMSSIHVDNWQLLPGKQRVQFTSQLLSQNNIMMDIVDQIVVKTSEGSEYRPVVQFQITIENTPLKDAQFNLNNRSSMQHPILIGQNILERGNFLIDPTKNQDAVRAESFDWNEHTENINWNELQEKLKDVKGDPYFHVVANNIENIKG